MNLYCVKKYNPNECVCLICLNYKFIERKKCIVVSRCHCHDPGVEKQGIIGLYGIITFLSISTKVSIDYLKCTPAKQYYGEI